MGCSASRIVSPGEAPPAGIRPIRRKIEQIRRQKRARKDSIVSTTELLGGAPEEILAEVPDEEEIQVDVTTITEEAEVPDEHVSSENFALPPPPPPPPPLPEVVTGQEEVDGADGKDGGEVNEKDEQEGREKEEEIGEERSEKEGDTNGDEKREKEGEEKWKGGELLRPKEDEEEFPGSPSFRVYSPYYRGSGRCSSDGESVKTGGSVIEDDVTGAASNKVDVHDRKDSLGSTNSEGSECSKLTKKSRGRRFKALAVCSLLSVRSCYHTNAIQQDKPHLLTQKAA